MRACGIRVDHVPLRYGQSAEQLTGIPGGPPAPVRLPTRSRCWGCYEIIEGKLGSIQSTRGGWITRCMMFVGQLVMSEGMSGRSVPNASLRPYPVEFVVCYSLPFRSAQDSKMSR